jgi:hypothetical protein
MSRRRVANGRVAHQDNEPSCAEECMNWIEAAGYLASALVLATFCMKTMIPLRGAAICSNFAFIVYGFYDNLYPVLILHGILLPLNVWRAAQMLRLIRRVEAASKGDLSTDWLRPFMKEAQWKAGEVIFNKGDHADRLYMILAGDVHFEQRSHRAHGRPVRRDRPVFRGPHPNPDRPRPDRCRSALDQRRRIGADLLSKPRDRVLLPEADDQSPACQCFTCLGGYGSCVTGVFFGFSLIPDVQAASSVDRLPNFRSA